jgi:hypothetical protein
MNAKPVLYALSQFALIAVLCSCASTSSVPSHVSAAGLKGRGLVLFSYTASGTYGDGYFVEVRPNLGYRMVGSKRQSYHPYEAVQLPRDRAAALTLKPGEYEFFEWRQGDGHGEFGGRLPTIIRFSVEAETVSYLGNIHLTFEGCGHCSVKVQDKRQEDMPSILNTCKDLSQERIQSKMMQPISTPKTTTGY